MCIKQFGIIAFVGAIIFLLGVSSDPFGVIGKAYARDIPDGLTDIPSVLITYKYGPEKLTDDILKKSLRQIVGQEQIYYRIIKQAKERNMKPPLKDEFLLFTEEQVAGRAVDFATEDLLEEYKAFLSKEAAAIPDQVRLDSYHRIVHLKYENSVINSNTASGQGADVFYKHSIEGERKKASIPALGARELFMGTNTLRSVVNSPGFAKLPRRYGSLQLAIDRVPIIPPVAVPRDEAEKLLTRPSCGRNPAYLNTKPDPQAVAAYESCDANSRRYEIGFRLSFVVTPEGFVEGTDILALRLNKVELYNPYGDLMKTYLPSDLPAATDTFAEQKTTEEKGAREEAVRKQAEEKSKTAMNSKIGAADIDGLTLFMTYSEAEAAVRNKLEIGRIRELKSAERTKPYFSDMTQFENIDGSERIMLFRGKPDSEKLVGIARMLDLPKGTTFKDVKDQLIDKYGEPTENFFSSGLTWHGHLEKRACAVSIRWVEAPAIKEGKALDGSYEKYGSFSVSPMYAVSGKSENDLLKGLTGKCSTQLFALVQLSRLLVVLLDFPAYAFENIDKDESKDVKLDL